MVALWDMLMLAFRSLGANKVRTTLTLLGMVIGVTTVVAMVSLVKGLQNQVDKQLEQLGAGVFQVQKMPHGDWKNWKKYAARKNMTMADAAALRALPSVAQVGCEAWDGPKKVSSHTASTGPNQVIVGGTPEFLDNNGMNLAHGRFINDDDLRDERPVAVIGYDIVDAVFVGQEPLGQEVIIDGSVYRVVGVIARQGAGLFGGSEDNLVVIPITDFFRHYGKNRSINITVKALSAELLPRAQDEVVATLRRRREVAPTQDNDFYMFTNDSESQSFNNFSQIVTAATIGVCLLSLMVGGFGVLNIMLVTVSERTSEIGVRKALGARKRRILMQFTAEAVVISLIGGAVGVTLGSLISIGARELFSIPTEIPVWAVALGLGVSTITGLIFGIYPASRAASLDPALAMRAG